MTASGLLFVSLLKKKNYLCTKIHTCLFIEAGIGNRGVAQLASAPRSGRGGRVFESHHPDFFI